MFRHLRANLWLLGLTLVVCCVLYPGILLVIGQTVFPAQASGSLIRDQNGKIIGSSLIAQPFTGDEYFKPRPSAVSYNAAASGASNWGANNALLRDRVARQLGPLVKYATGPKQGQPVGPDVERWVQENHFEGKPGIVGEWAQFHPTLARNWLQADPANAEAVAAWQAAHPQEVAQWIKDNPGTTQPKPDDLVVVYFQSFSHEHPGSFPVAVERKTPDDKTEKKLEPAANGQDIQATFFDMWRQEHPQADLEPVPADMVMASGSGLDPHITMQNALSQLDGVAAKWGAETKRDPAQIRVEIAEILRQNVEAPLGGLVGVDLVNVLQINLALRDRYRPHGKGT